jgi:hypothetical protein
MKTKAESAHGGPGRTRTSNQTVMSGWSTTPSTSCTSMASTRARRHWSSGSDPIEGCPGFSSDIGANTSRSLEAGRIVDRRLKAERGNRTETGRGHEFANLHIMVRQLQNLTYAVDLAIGTRGGARHHSATVDEDGHYSFAVAL